MTELSPAAQAVLDAMHRSYDHEPTRRLIAAAVLRAAVASMGLKTPGGGVILDGVDLLAIAAELEAHDAQ